MRCKVSCSFKQPSEDGGYLFFNVVYTGSEENKKFFKYTPGGIVNFTLARKDVYDKFEVGKEYYIDFISAIAR